MKFLLPVVCLLVAFHSQAQMQACPLNSNFSAGDLTHWAAYTGNNSGGNPASVLKNYDTVSGAPTGTAGVSSITEYNLPSVIGIEVINGSNTDFLGGFATIPTINGYKYTNSVKLGSTAISRSGSTGVQGGYVRGVSYNISVPASPSGQPYTMTYAYAMVLENGTHNSNQQPLFSATLVVDGKIIACASPKYFLPTRDNADTRGSGATLDTALAQSQGIYLSQHPSPNSNPNSNNPGAEHLMDVWAKNWAEVTFDLSPYRGKTVVLTFEADNCVPGGHFAYAYVALRKDCNGLTISGPIEACINSDLIYSIPGLTGANYQWTVPPGWQILSGSDSNILKVHIGSSPGQITALETNSCATLRDELDVVTTPPTVAGFVKDNNEVCAGVNSSVLTLSNNVGKVLTWLSSTDNGNSWNPLSVTGITYTAQDLQKTTNYRALVQNGESCDIDTSAGVVVIVDPKTVGGKLDPADMVFCMGQNKDALLTLTGSVGGVVNWQSSPDGISWADFAPALKDTFYNVLGITASSRYRLILKSGVCPIDSSSIAYVNLLNIPFPQAVYSPADTPICYGDAAPLNATITLGTSYSWNNAGPLTNQGDGNIDGLPYEIHAVASPLATTNYILSIVNSGCPNPLKDTFHINVHQQIIVDAGRDTAVVFNQPLQLHASSNDPEAGIYRWDPATGLDNAFTPDPIATLGPTIDSVRYTATAATEAGCKGKATILVKVFKTLPDIFVPNAFTPGGINNSIFRPVPVGIATFQYFRVYNRYGQLVFSTTQSGRGWDGRVNGKLQEPGAFVWMVQGLSYMGKTVFHKGTVILVR